MTDASGSCGTYAGAQRHKRLRQPLCDECLTAQRDYMRNHRRKLGPQSDRWWNRTRREALQRLAEEYPVRFAEILAEIRQAQPSTPWDPPAAHA